MEIEAKLSELAQVVKEHREVLLTEEAEECSGDAVLGGLGL